MARRQMGNYEDLVRSAIKSKFGSIPKMSEATGIPITTIYHALDRGLQNTRSETLKRIQDSLFDWAIPEFGNDFSEDECELINCYRACDERGKAIIMATAKATKSVS